MIATGHIISEEAVRGITDLASGKKTLPDLGLDALSRAIKDGTLSEAQEAKFLKLAARLEKAAEISLAAKSLDATINVNVRRQAFLDKYSIVVLGDGQVSFKLPIGASRIDLLNDAQALAPKLYKQDAVFPPQLKKWRADSAFTAEVTEGEGLERGVEGNITNSTGKDRVEQETKGWGNIDLCDLATAHAAYFIATGKDLFDGKVVLAHGGALLFDDDGLCRYDSTVAVLSTMSQLRRNGLSGIKNLDG